MSIEYTLDGKKFLLDYKKLRTEYHRLCNLSDAEFMQSLPKALHLACMICFLKDIPTEWALSDVGIVHELVHLLDIGDEPSVELQNIRENFMNELELK